MFDPAYISAITIFTLMVISPGPSALAIMNIGMAEGRLQAMILTLGILTGSLFWGLIALFGFSGILQFVSEWLFVFKIVGGLYLIFLAFTAIKKAIANEEPKALKLGRLSGLKAYYIAGLGLHITNPKAVYGWLATITVGVSESAPFGDALNLFLICICITTTGHMGYALLFSTKRLSSLYRRARRAIQFTFAGFFTFAGLNLIFQR